MSLTPAKLNKLRKLCLALAGATEKEAWGDPTWRVRDKIFAMQKGNSRGHRPSVWFKAVDQALLVESDPRSFFVPPYVGSKGWVGAYLDREVDWTLLSALIAESHSLVAPKKKTVRGASRR
jgi:predicted DNA-binding protein (MmcQ/YjbR family)